MDIITLGIDLGRSEIRLSDGEQVIALPTLLGGPVSTVQRGQSRVGDDFLESQLAVRLGRRSYSVGQLALAQAVDFPVNDPDLFADELNLVLLLALLGLYVRRRGLTGTPRFKIALGLPVGLSRRRAHVEAHLATWVGLHQFELAGESLAFEIVQIDPMPTAVGAVYAALLEGQVAFSAAHNVGVIDAGHTSTDYLVVRLPHELSAYSGHSSAAAGCRLEQILGEFLESEGLVRVHPLRLREALATRVYVDGGTRIDIPESLWGDTLEPLAQHVALTVKQAWRDLAIERMVLVGGFGKFLYPYLVQFPYFRDCLLADDVRHLNVRGLFEYALASPLRSVGASAARIQPVLEAVPAIPAVPALEVSPAIGAESASLPDSVEPGPEAIAAELVPSSEDVMVPAPEAAIETPLETPLFSGSEVDPGESTVDEPEEAGEGQAEVTSEEISPLTLEDSHEPSVEPESEVSLDPDSIPEPELESVSEESVSLAIEVPAEPEASAAPLTSESEPAPVRRSTRSGGSTARAASSRSPEPAASSEPVVAAPEALSVTPPAPEPVAAPVAPVAPAAGGKMDQAAIDALISGAKTAPEPVAAPVAPAAPAAGGKMDQAAIDALISGAKSAPDPVVAPVAPAAPAAAGGKLEQGNIDALIASLAAQG